MSTELFYPSYARLTTSPLPLSPSAARLCLTRLHQLTQSRPDALSANDLAAIKAAFVAGYSAFAAGTDDYSSLDLPKLRQTCERAFVYTADVLVAMLKALPLPADQVAKAILGRLSDGTALYDEGIADGEQMVSLAGSPVVSSLSDLLTMTNEVLVLS